MHFGYHTRHMNESTTQWTEKAWSLIEELSNDATGSHREEWRFFASNKKPVVTLFGAYDSGKSSLLKRLLLDESKPIPSWLTISARRETFESNEAEVCGVVMVDTPGLAGGNPVHESVTSAALLAADAVIVMLPCQLVTGDAQAVAAIMGVLDGTYYNSGSDAAFPVGGLIIVLARMDEAGASPDIDLQGYESLLRRKKDELRSLLSKHGISGERLAIHCVVADWSGGVGDAENATSTDYDGSRAWDGIAALAKHIRSLPVRKDELRTSSELRFLRYHLGKIRELLQAQGIATQLGVESAENEVECLNLQDSRLEVLIGNARANLEHRVAEEVRTICTRQDTDPDTVKSLLNARLQSSLDRWYQSNDSAVQNLVEEFDAEIEERHQRPDWQAMAAQIAARVEGTSNSPGGTPNDGIHLKPADLHKGGRLLKTAVTDAAPLVIDMPLKKAREELDRFKQAGSFQNYAKEAARRKGTFRSASHAKRAETMLKVHQAVTVAAPVIIEIVGIVGEHRAEALAAEERINKRATLQKQLDETGRSIIDEVWRCWNAEGIAGAATSALKDLLTAASARVALLKAQADSTRDARSRVTNLLS